ncbi:MAG: MFS transporter [Deltaproteobacteria bacterium]|nr:MFS transporter [Deltaproteobacteria bacterium]MBW1931195.1 MFS transporter [Deltaproteobacteria bacterium]MBW2027145.1 MFS transporter [Deltaproteobacteria bacterium]MBW2127163.1 MFS transporter [Deltaproteobacteria bacterium]RLB16511.1 MAG: MFS transporter [Deltaproteobacteria bacterium]
MVFMAQFGQLLFLALIFFLNFMARISTSPLMPQIEMDLKLDHAQAGSFFLIISAGYFVALLGSGFVSSRITHKKTIVVSALSVGSALIALSLSQSLFTMRLCFLMTGLATGIYLPSGIATLTSLVDQKHWGKAIAVHELAPNASFVAAPLLAEGLMGWFSWRGVLVCLGISSGLVGIAFGILGKGGRFHGEAPGLSVINALVREPAFWIMTVLFSLGIAATLGIYTMLPLFLVVEKGMTRGWANSLVGLSRISGVFMAMVAGLINDWIGPKKTMFAVFFVTGLLSMALGVVSGPWTALMVFLQPLLAVCFFPPGFAALSSIGPSRARNVAVSFAVPMGFVLGGGLIPFMIGVAGDMGSFGMGISISGGLIFVGSFLTLKLKTR